jgi:hypothetical protein
MAVNNIFISGMEKCGTTALAEWMVVNGLAEYRVPGVKEPYLYSSDELHPARFRLGNLPLLDASVGYACDPGAVRRLPEYDTRIVLCLRNQFERTWSSYKMKKLFGTEGANADDYFLSYSKGSNPGRKRNASTSLKFMHALFKKHFPRRSHAIIEQYVDQELAHIQSHDFITRIEYELGFYLSRREFPFFSILLGSFYHHPLRNVLRKYQPSDISVISVNRLKDDGLRRQFVEGVLEKELDTPAIPSIFSSAEIEIDEPKPDFSDKAFDMLRAAFRYDLAAMRALVGDTRFGDSMLDNAALERHLDAR